MTLSSDAASRPRVMAFVYGEGGDDPLVTRANAHLETWADDIFFMYLNQVTESWSFLPAWVSVLVLDWIEKDPLEHIRRARALSLAQVKEIEEATHVAFLSPTQVVANPALVLPTVKAYPDRIILATRYWMWDEGKYRVDAPWKPRQVPFIFPMEMVRDAVFRPGAYWPDITLESSRIATSELELQDYSFYQSDLLAVGTDLRNYAGVQLLG